MRINTVVLVLSEIIRILKFSDVVIICRNFTKKRVSTNGFRLRLLFHSRICAKTSLSMPFPLLAGHIITRPRHRSQSTFVIFLTEVNRLL